MIKPARTWRAWLVYDRERAEKNADYIRMHKQIGRTFGFDFELKMIEETGCDISGLPDFAIVRTVRPGFSRKLESLGVPVFNNSLVADICNDKGKTIAYISSHTDVLVVPTSRFFNRELSGGLLARHPDSVIKAVDGHGGSQVFYTKEPYERIAQGLGASDFVIQPFIDGPGKDIRIYVVGNEIAGAVERTAENGFRANYSLGAKVRRYIPDKETAGQVYQLCRLFSFGLAGIDFLVARDGRLLLSEIEDVVGARMLYRCNPDAALLERYFAFIRDKLLRSRPFMGIIGSEMDDRKRAGMEDADESRY